MTVSIKLFVIGSVLLNLLLAGVIIGHGCHFYGKEAAAGREEKVLAALPEIRQEEYKAAMDHVRSDNAALFEKMKEAHEKKIEALKADSFNEKDYQDQVDILDNLRSTAQKRLNDAIKRLAKRWSPEERAVLAELHYPLRAEKK